jgi:hypothetical protein
MSRCRITFAVFIPWYFECVCVGGGGLLINIRSKPNNFLNKSIHFPAFDYCAVQCFLYGSTVPVGLGLRTVEVSRSSWDTPHSIGLLWIMIHPSQRPLNDDTQQTQQTDFHVPGGIRAAADPRLLDRAATGIGIHFTYLGLTHQHTELTYIRRIWFRFLQAAM